MLGRRHFQGFLLLLFVLGRLYLNKKSLNNQHITTSLLISHLGSPTTNYLKNSWQQFLLKRKILPSWILDRQYEVCNRFEKALPPTILRTNVTVLSWWFVTLFKGKAASNNQGLRPWSLTVRPWKSILLEYWRISFKGAFFGRSLDFLKSAASPWCFFFLFPNTAPPTLTNL